MVIPSLIGHHQSKLPSCILFFVSVWYCFDFECVLSTQFRERGVLPYLHHLFWPRYSPPWHVNWWHYLFVVVRRGLAWVKSIYYLLVTNFSTIYHLLYHCIVYCFLNCLPLPTSKRFFWSQIVNNWYFLILAHNSYDNIKPMRKL